MNRGASVTSEPRRIFAALVLSFALLQAFTFVPTAIGAPGDNSCDKPGNGNDKKCETPPPTPPPPPTATPPPTQPPTATPPPPSEAPTGAPDPETPAPSEQPGGGTAAPSQEPGPSSSPSPTTSPAPTQSPGSSPAPTTTPSTVPTTTPTTTPSDPPPSSNPVVTPPPPTDPPVFTPPPVETEPPPTAPPPGPTPFETQPPPPGDPQPPAVTDPTPSEGREPLAPVETDDPGTHRPVLFPAPDGGGPQSPIVDALEDLAENVSDPAANTASVPEESGHAFGLRVPLGASFGVLARTAGKAVQEFAFPLTLAIAVLLFLLFQGELDRRDPKLAYAPVDSTKDMVSFE